MIKLFKRNRTQIFYNNCDIPAKLFYNEVIGNSNLSVLGKGNPEQLEKAFYGILDELCAIEDNKEMIAIYRKREKLVRLNLILTYIETVLHQLAYIKMPEDQRLARIEKLNSLSYPRVKFDPKKPNLDEVERVGKSVVGMLKNQINSEQADVEKKGEKAKSTFEAEVLALAKITGIRLNDHDSLRYFAELKVIAKEQIKAQEKANGR